MPRSSAHDPDEGSAVESTDEVIDDAPTGDAPTDPSVESLTYEQARDELVQVVANLESGGVPLADSLALWERGEALAAHCQEFLDGARSRLEAARPAPDDPALG